MAARDVTVLEEWLADVQASNLAPLVALANGIMADCRAVEAPLRLPWSSGRAGTPGEVDQRPGVWLG
jgi:hypothetical protein